MSKHIRKVLGLLQHRKQIQQIPPPHQQPTSRTPEEWSTYWKAQGQPWRTEPEIDKKRQEYLAKRRLITPNIEQGIYPFKDVEPKLTRADIEWLLATHQSGGICGPVDCSDERQREREGLDLRGAHLEGEDLSGLPLARIHGGLTFYEESSMLIEEREINEEPRERAAVLLQKAKLAGADLQEAFLRGANLQEAYLLGGNLQKAYLMDANLQKAYLVRAHLQEANLCGADLQEAYLWVANLQGAELVGAHLQEAFLRGANLQGAELLQVTLGNEIQVGPQLADSQWGDVNLAVIKWTQVKILGDEYVARQKRDSEGKTKGKQTRLSEYEAAVRANRQLAVALQGQGLNEDAARFAYRAQVLQKSVLWYQMTQQGTQFGQRMQALGGWLFSWFLFLLAGYGYRPRRALGWYLLTICVFAWAYYQAWACYHLERVTHHPLSLIGAAIFSITAFHGRGFFLGGDLGYDNLVTILGALEAVIGLLIELSFIATFTLRFFGK